MSFADVSEKKIIEKARWANNFELVDFWIPLAAARIGWEGGRGNHSFPDRALPTLHAREIRVRCPDYDANPCLVLLLFDSFVLCRAPFNSSSEFFP